MGEESEARPTGIIGKQGWVCPSGLRLLIFCFSHFFIVVGGNAVLHLLYILAFTVLAVLAVGNLIRNLMLLGANTQQRSVAPAHPNRAPQTLHPEMLGDDGQPVREPLLVMKSMTMEDARSRLDALYNASPGGASSSDPANDEA